MKLICGWCEIVIRVVDDRPGPPSHGMCVRCFFKELQRDGLESARDKLDRRERNAEDPTEVECPGPAEGRDPALPGL